jgi:hypothetical protein
MTRYPNTFKVRGSGSPNIVTLGFAPRSLARSQALALAAWLIAFVGDLPTFARIMLDVWVSRYGLEQTPKWLLDLTPDWRPYEPPAKPVAPPPTTTRFAIPPGIAPGPDLPVPIARQGSGPTVPRFTTADGTPLDGDGMRAIADEATRALTGGESAAPRPLPTPLASGDGSEPNG